ncbi:hypothetical protein AEP_00854 [Curvibacter sp. AEP1-3]|nr:hypothetical protein AEP_00854 [Curvibacter sp. AEP1-3]
MVKACIYAGFKRLFDSGLSTTRKESYVTIQRHV